MSSTQCRKATPVIITLGSSKRDEPELLSELNPDYPKSRAVNSWHLEDSSYRTVSKQNGYTLDIRQAEADPDPDPLQQT